MGLSVGPLLGAVVKLGEVEVRRCTLRLCVFIICPWSPEPSHPRGVQGFGNGFPSAVGSAFRPSGSPSKLGTDAAVLSLCVPHGRFSLQTNPNYSQEKNRCEYLHNKLAHIKKLIAEYDQQQF